MSEKKFTTKNIVCSNYCVWDNNDKPYGNDEVVELLNEQQATIELLENDKAFAEDYANIFEKENVKLRKKLNNYKATVLGFIWIMKENGRIKDNSLCRYVLL